MTLKLGEGLIQDHWKWRRSIDHKIIRLFIGPQLYIYAWYRFLSYLTLKNIVTLKKNWVIRLLKVIQTGTIRQLGCGFLFAFHSRPKYGRIFSHL